MLSSFDIEQSLYKLFRKLARGKKKKKEKKKQKERKSRKGKGKIKRKGKDKEKGENKGKETGMALGEAPCSAEQLFKAVLCRTLMSPDGACKC